MARKIKAIMIPGVGALLLQASVPVYAAAVRQPEFMNTLMPEPAQLTVDSGQLDLSKNLIGQ